MPSVNQRLLTALGLLPLALAGPVAIPAVQSPKPTAAPALAPRQDAEVVTYQVSNCVPYQDPHEGVNACQCSGMSGLLPASTDGTTCYDYTEIVTATASSSYNQFPCTTTWDNDAIVAYADTTLYPEATEHACAGESTTLQAGSSVSLQMNPSGTGSKVNVGFATMEDERNALYTQVSSAIMAGCPTPSEGETVTACSDIPQITDISRVDTYRDFYPDGKIDITVVLVSYTDIEVLEVLAGSIASGVWGAAGTDGNTDVVDYFWSKEDGNRIDLPITVNQTSVPSLYQALFSRQTEETNGEVEVQNLQVEIALDTVHDTFDCADVGLVLAGIAALSTLSPGWGWLAGGAIGGFGRLGLAAGCTYGHM